MTHAIDFACTRNVTAPLWEALREATRPWMVRDFHLFISANPSSIDHILRVWERSGLVAGSGYPKAYRMTDEGAALRGRPVQNNVHVTGLRQPTGQQRIWTAMRVLGRFDIPTLMMTTDCARGLTETYVRCLRKAGYLATVRSPARHRGEHAIYRLARVTGPKAPTIASLGPRKGAKRQQLHDPNTGEKIDLSADGARAVNHV